MGAVLVFTDGKKTRVGYGKAAEIFQILEGNKRPKNKAQREFVEKIANVIFDQVPLLNDPTPIKRKVTGPDEKMGDILSDPYLSGRDRARAVADRLKERSGR
jgi:hypothetical protein